MAAPVDYSTYLVTDSTAGILGDRDLCQVVEAALQGGVTIVQYRDKHSSRDVVVETAKKLHDICKRFQVPFLINDQVDVAAEIGCEGAHIGQDDLDIKQARELLGPNKIIGVTASSIEEALQAAKAGADYLGIGTVYSTQTKKDTKSIIGPSGVRTILSQLAASRHGAISTVCIGGINISNTQQVMTQSSAPAKSLDGVAVVSAIIAAADPAAAARELSSKVLTAKVPDVIRAVAKKTPLSHNMTNLVVQNFAANVGLAVGASPIMANYAEEAADLAKLGGSLVINMGTVTPDGLKNYIQALEAYNAAGGPVLLDPVGAGATAVRRSAVKTLLAAGSFAVIKGNEGEIQTLHGASVTQRGVDSDSTLSLAQRASVVQSVARAHGSVVLMTGVTDILSDGRRTFRVDNGHELLAQRHDRRLPEDTLVAAVAGTAMFGVAAELAAGRAEVRGPGTFVPAFIDELYGVRKATAENDSRWLSLVKIARI
uniref:Thiamine phosphate synthase/TenI domain-containing protein n=1 Tax=Bionectria ochroleuca TaxID=29856 RepID=A0A8H7NAQ4_BIOOC